MANKNPRLVQSCINSVGYPTTVNEFRKCVEWRMKESKSVYKSLNTDEFFRSFDSKTGISCPMRNDYFERWTSPRWFTEGDVSFFYHTKSALQSSIKVRNKLTQALAENREKRSDILLGVSEVSRKHVERLLEIANRGVTFAEQYSGQIFAVARASKNFIARRPHQDLHWKSINYCDYEGMYFLDKPISIDLLKPEISIGQSTITPLTRNGFERVREQVFKSNKQVDWLRDLQHRDTRITEIAKSQGWRGVALDLAPVFIFESQVREYLITPFLKEIFVRCKILEEVRTSRDAINLGILDYLVNRRDISIPVEAKVVIIDSSGLRAQLRKYCSTNIPLESGSVRTTPFCLVMDHEKILLYTPKRRSNGDPEKLEFLTYYAQIAQSDSKLLQFQQRLNEIMGANHA